MITFKNNIASSVCCGLFAALLAMPLFSSCSDFFETDSDRQIFDPALDQKTDSMFYTLGILKGLQQVADQYVLTGEMRGDLVAVNNYTETDLKKLADFTADATCKFDSAYKYYRIINNCNYYLAHRDTSLLTGSRKVTIPEYAEALAVRAWSYLQLAKNYGEVPFYTNPLTSIGDANSSIPTKNLQAIVDELAPEMIKYSGTPVPSYGEVSAGVLNSSDSDNPTEKKIQSKYAMLPIDVVLGDLFLETHQYEQAAHYYFQYIKNNNLVANQAKVSPTTKIMMLLEEKWPSQFSIIGTGFTWQGIFNGGTNDIVTYIPLAANRLRGAVTELPRYFGYDFYSTTSGQSESNERYLLERQVDASASYIALAEAQDFYYTPTNSTTGTINVNIAQLGDLRRRVTMNQISKNDSTYSVMIKFNSANIPLYRSATVYLRLAEAINRMGYPDVAFAILKDGIYDGLIDFIIKEDGQDDTKKRYIRKDDFVYNGATKSSPEKLLTSTLPFLSPENINKFKNNWGIHGRGSNYTRGTESPYQMDSVVTKKIAELQTVYGITTTGTLNDTINAMEDIICDEMALELAYEGTRFGDLTRIARHKNQEALYGANFGSAWMAKKLGYKAAGLEERLKTEQNWYLPFK
ncbi:RagB/SusD family nutrient uptake outer membrane protein [Prevotella sp. E9-3]|uniref:RagB/SusD family nutrient uptake outer membrane protein n=1 Tax=Prevotella sp. E9-3 TaxID=2913621 RepID=UPI001EDB31DA|nr:RagB/SusD family nutrient uptake outer membrane protein [Prevotella sp. E9-3]UKK48367.1 RagB/SusD family nutrient uptake outer membrane protein [Prevotella sp. E9-3]